MSALPEGRLVAYYGDDYTGSAAVMEVMTFAGLPTVLFLDVPTPERLSRFARHRGIGIAGIARSQAPAWMDRHLPPIFAALAGLGAPITHYKVCSTFDSAPQVGSIGHAIDLAIPILGGAWHPMLVASPALGRYQAFGNLFGTIGHTTYRLDRHPVMARHPVTPMHEADLGLHLARQTARRVGLVDLLALSSGGGEAALARARTDGADIVSFDILDEATLAEAGRLVWENRGARLFAVGSQGLQSALIAHWHAAGLLPRLPEGTFTAGPVERIVAASGSCSPITAEQITVAGGQGFTPLALDATRAVDPQEWEREIGRAEAAALAVLDAGQDDPLLYTALGPADPAVAALNAAVAASGIAIGTVNDRIGAGLGRLVARLLRRTGIRRAVIAGGDTSGHAAQALGLYALEARAPLAPGAPLCRAHADDPATDGLEIALKGGQGGAPDFFAAARRGGTNAH